MAAAVSIAVVGYAVLPNPLFREVPDMTAKIEAITDIEHLRKMALLLQGQSAVLTIKANELYASALKLMITLAAFSSMALFYFSWLLRRPIRREGDS